jgi:tRNA pseudouridine38-40 synthase
MPRYFLEVSYKGTRYSGFQSQENANTVQAEVEKAMNILLGAKVFPTAAGELSGIQAPENVLLTGSSRTDTGVHALQNFFHFDSENPFNEWRDIKSESHFIYKMNAILPEDIAVKSLIPVRDDAHCRFDAESRLYHYYIYRKKDPFLKERAFYFPYKMDLDKLNQAAQVLKEYTDFTSFSKRNTQVKSFICVIMESEWVIENDCLVYHVKANRFLRGMVRALVATMLQAGRNKITIDEFRSIIESRDCTKASFSVPGKGLFLMRVNYPEGVTL